MKVKAGYRGDLGRGRRRRLGCSLLLII